MSREYHLAVVAQRDEQLAAQAAQLAAGQALADHLYRQIIASSEDCGPYRVEPELTAFLAAFPPANAGFPVGAFPLSDLTGEVIDLSRPRQKPPIEEPPSAEVVDLVAALRGSLDRKGGAR